MKSVSLNPIGFVRSTRIKPEDDNWDVEKTSIELDSTQFPEEALLGLSEFSHVEIIFYMDQVDPSKVEKSARHPRNNPNWPKTGIFAQRAKNRPNQIGATICKITSVTGRILSLEGLDAIDGTPVLDIKPWVAEFAPRGPVFQPKWITELMRTYWRT
jgi:tRNA (adenine37-N6)-methyltransferase